MEVDEGEREWKRKNIVQNSSWKLPKFDQTHYSAHLRNPGNSSRINTNSLL